MNIKTCPFCGSNSVSCASDQELNFGEDTSQDSTFCVNCDFQKGGCGATGPFRLTIDEAIEAWNRRA